MFDDTPKSLMSLPPCSFLKIGVERESSPLPPSHLESYSDTAIEVKTRKEERERETKMMMRIIGGKSLSFLFPKGPKGESRLESSRASKGGAFSFSLRPFIEGKACLDVGLLNNRAVINDLNKLS